LFLGDSHATTPMGWGSNALHFWGFRNFRSIYAYTVCRRTTKFDVVTRGGGHGQPRLSSQLRGVPALSNLGGGFSRMYTGTPNDQIWCGNTYGEGLVFIW